MTTATTTAPRIPAPQRTPMDGPRKTALTAGVFYLITFVSIPTIALYGRVHEAGYMVSGGSDTPLLIGGILEVLVALAGIGTAVALYPVVRRQNVGLALGLVSSRVLEAAMLFVGVASLLTIVTLRQDGAGAEASIIGTTLVAFYDRAFLLGGSLMPAVNAVLLGTLMYRSRLVPRLLPTLGLIGVPLLLLGHAGVWFGAWDRLSPVTGLSAFPIAIWEFSLGMYLVIKGFRSEGLARLNTPAHPASD